MVIWSGWGLLPVVFGFLGLMLGVLIDRALVGAGLPPNTGMVVGALLGAVANWIVGTRLNNVPGRELVDPATGQRVVLKRRHTLFWIPMQYWSIVMILFAGIGLLGMLGMGSGPRTRV